MIVCFIDVVVDGRIDNVFILRCFFFFFFFFQAEDGIRDGTVTGVQTCALPIYPRPVRPRRGAGRRRRRADGHGGRPHRPVDGLLDDLGRARVRHDPERHRQRPGAVSGLAGLRAAPDVRAPVRALGLADDPRRRAARDHPAPAGRALVRARAEPRPGMTGSPVLEVRRIMKPLDQLVAARDIDVTIATEEVVSIIGANGAGKTTFVNLVTGYTHPSGGSIRFRGQELVGLPPREITRLGVCRSFQVPQVFSTMSVLENLMIAHGLSDRGRGAGLSALASRDRVEACAELLSVYRIEAYRDRPAALVPQGVRKLLDIAMATVREATLLFLDEPTSGIATEEKFAVMDIVMAALAQRKATVVFIEHDIDIVERYGRRVLAFHEGGILADGPAADVLGDARVREHVTGRRRA